jgi:hypothetical protein
MCESIWGTLCVRKPQEISFQQWLI